MSENDDRFPEGFPEKRAPWGDNKTFSSMAKEELCRERLTRPCCTRAEAYGVLLFCNGFSGDEIRIVTTSPAVAQRLPRLFRRAFGVRFDRQPGENARGKQIFVMNDPAKLGRILDTFGYDRGQVSHHINYAVLEESCCQAAFFRGAFLAAGSIMDPRQRYHLELTTSHYAVSRELAPLLAEMDFHPKTTTRRGNYVTYFKQSEAIADFLTAIGAPLSAMELMNAKLEKNIMNRVNRRSNCDMANLDKAVAAAQGQIAAIRTLRSSPRWDALPENLRDTAELRTEHPELSLSQLAELAGVSKSCLNHRLRRLMELAEEQNSASRP